MPEELPALSEDCPSLRFVGKFADIEALNRGDDATLRPFIEPETRRALRELPANDKEVALILGGNGFVGAHLAARLSREPKIREVWASVRATASETPQQRFLEMLSRYKIDANLAKIKFVEADPTRTMFGLPSTRYEQLANDVDLVFNCASSSDYSVSYLELREAWLKSLLRILQFSIQRKRKHLTYMGSISSYFYQQPEDFRRPDSWWYSGYAQMKWVNGKILNWLAHDGDLSITLCEAPYILGATGVGIDPAQHYAWWRIIEMAKSIGMIWDGPGMCYIPVDQLAEVLAINSLRPEPLARLLPRNPEPYHNQMIAELLDLKVVPWDRFIEQISLQIPTRRVSTDFCVDITELIQKVNDAPSMVPPEYVPQFDNRRVYINCFDNIEFRDVRSKTWLNKPREKPASITLVDELEPVLE